MSNVTNNENMRRYVHMSLSNKSSNSGSGDGSGSSFPGVMIVTGQVNDNEFSPNEGQPTIREAYDHFKAGGTLIFHQPFLTGDGELFYRAVAAFSGQAKVGGGTQISIFTDSKELANALLWTEIQDGDRGGAGIIA